MIKDAGNGYYYLISKCNGLYLDLEGGTSKIGTNVEVYTPNYCNWQKFKFTSTTIQANKTIESGSYTITTCLNRNKVIDVEGDIITDKANIEIWENNEGNNQKFIITYLNDGYYTIKAFNSNKVLDIKDSSWVSGANVIQTFYTGKDSQKWAIQKIDDSENYYIVNKQSGMVLDIEWSSAKNGTNVEVFEKNNGSNQKFNFIKTNFSSTIKDGKYAILSYSNNKKAVDIAWAATNDGANVNLWDANGENNQSFYIKYDGNGYYTIEALCSQKRLTSKDGNVIQSEANNSDSQKWSIQKADKNGSYAIRSKLDDKYLDIKNKEMPNGTNIQVYIGNDNSTQRFKLEELQYKGIDVSKFQNDIDWKVVRNQVDFSIIRIGYRGYSNGSIKEDRYYAKNIKEATENNINCGVYFFSQAINEKEGIEEANWVLDKINGYNIKYPIAIDTEWSNDSKDGRADNISKDARTQAIKGFCKTIKSKGYIPIIYASKDWIKNQINLGELSEYDVWLAHYVSGAPIKKTDYTGKYSIWQYTSSGTIKGISGNVDIDICYKKYI